MHFAETGKPDQCNVIRIGRFGQTECLPHYFKVARL